MVKKVTDPKKIVTDKLVLRHLAQQGIDKDFVELWHDYAPRSRGKEHSPYAKFYRDLKSNKRFMVVAGLPKVNADGVPVDVGWRKIGNTYQTKPNVFSARVIGERVILTCINDQPWGAKKGETANWQPQLLLKTTPLGNWQPQPGLEPTLLPTDPMNEDYHQNVLEWDYGICKRRIRVFEGRFRERWKFESNPHGSIKIKHDFQGSLKLKLGYARDAAGHPLQVSVIGDEEVVAANELNRPDLVYPVEIGSEQTFYPDEDPEVSSVDGYTARLVAARPPGETWAQIIARAGTDADPSIVGDNAMNFSGHSAFANYWYYLGRAIFLFDTAGLPDDATKTAAILSIRGWGKNDGGGNNPDVNIYSSNPNTNVTLIPADHGTLGTTPFSTTIAYAAWIPDDYNDFIFNQDGLDAISLTVVSKFGTRDATHDVGGSEPPNKPANGYYHQLRCDFSEEGTGKKPRLVVTYEALNVASLDTTDITAVTAKLNGEITEIGAEDADERGVEWGGGIGLFAIAVDSAAHTVYGLSYPATYKFNIPAAADNMTVFERKASPGSWNQLPTKTGADFFNGIDAVRFDYDNDLAYVSVGFGPITDTIELLFCEDGVPVDGCSFVEITEYYDDRKAACVITADDIVDSYWDAKVDAMTETIARSIWLTIGLITAYEDEVPWSAVQTLLDQGYLEPGSHSRTHVNVPFPDYDSEVNGSKQDIIDNLDLPALNKKGSTEYVYAWTAPYGASDATLRSKLGEYKYLEDTAALLGTSYGSFPSWDLGNGVYNYWNGYGIEEDLTLEEMNAQWDTDYAAGNIYHLRWHPATFTGASRTKMIAHLDHIKEKKDVWYVGMGHLFVYHYLQDRGQVLGLVTVAEAEYYDNSWTENGTFGVGLFEHPLTGLNPDTTYHCRAKAHTPTGGWVYGADKEFTTSAAALPTVTTDPATSITHEAADLNGVLTDDGNEVCDCGFEWGETEAYGNTTPTLSKTTGQTFALTISGLDPNKTYHFRAFATNGAGTSYGADRSFTSLVLLPTVTTDPATALSAIAATLDGTLDHDGGEACDCGFEWGLDTGYGTITATESKTLGESFSQVIGGLSPATTYHFRAFAINSIGTSYGADRSFASAQVISRSYALARREL